MKNKEQTVKQAVKEYYAEKSLSNTQIDELQTLLTGHAGKAKKTHSGWYKLLGSVAASVLMFMVVFSYVKTPQLINYAYADIMQDAHLNNGLKTEIQRWLNDNRIERVPEEYKVEMSKFCFLDKMRTTHIRIAGKEQGVMNVFIHRADQPLKLAGRSGHVEDMHWRLIKLDNDLMATVLYTDDMREQSVNHILGEIFAGRLA